MIEVDGAAIARWAAQIGLSQLRLLAGSECSDPYNIWLVEAAEERGLSILNCEKGGRQDGLAHREESRQEELRPG